MCEILEQTKKEVIHVYKTYGPLHAYYSSRNKFYQNFNGHIEFNNPVENYEEIQFNNISEANIYNIFTIPSDITTYLVNKFPEIRFLQQGTVLIQHFINETKNSKSVIPTVVLNISPSHFDMIVVKSGELLYYNIYDYKTEDDLIYYMINTYNKLSLDIEKTETIIMGDIKGANSLHKKLQMFLSFVRFGTSKKDFTYNFPEIPEHYLSNIISA